MLKKYLIVLVLCLTAKGNAALSFETSAKQAILLDARTGTVLYEKNPDQLMHPASLTKIMTAHLLFERLKDGRLKPQDTLPVSELAWRTGGSRMFIEVNTKVTVDDLLHGVIIQSGNDASVAVAEGLSGTHDAFAQEMTQAAMRLGMTRTIFKNATGLPDVGHTTTVRDLAILSLDTINNYPEFYPLYGIREFTYNNIRQYNRNPLLSSVQGADGLKTGFTDEAGYCLVGSAQRRDRRLLMVLGGFSTAKARAIESSALMEWGFREFKNLAPFRAGDTVATADVWMGVIPTIPLVIKENIVLTVPARVKDTLTATVHFDGLVKAPVRKDQVLGKLTFTYPEIGRTFTYPVHAGTAVDKVGVLTGIKRRVRYLFFGAAS